MTSLDPLSEAEVYAAYGRTAQAIAMLRQALQAQPEREDIRQRLQALELQAEKPHRLTWALVLAAWVVVALIFAVLRS
ncbi:FimV family protein [Roseateles sp. DC23W]|uniref:FimV family protein n=1 Tax=Pelomonas dachongensis TaxID=3299029 RepID=A0ABW7EQG6_9BURK